MGYDLTRFIVEVDEEFNCAICCMILENPLQSPCEHTFCSKCIKEWLVSNKFCPVDQKSLTIDELKATPRYFRNMLDKLEITCEFKPKCKEIIKLENYQDHFSNCEQNPNAEVICDKGCSLKITRHEYQINNCSSHLVNRFNSKEEEILELRQTLSIQQDYFEREFKNLREQFTILNDEVSRLRIQQEDCANTIGCQQVEIAKFGEKCNILAVPPRWQVLDNINVSFGEPNILESGGNSKSGFAQSFYSLNPAKNSFKVQILSGLSDFVIGLSHLHTGCDDKNNMRYQTGVIHSDGKYEKHGPQWKIGDFIECGIIFPSNFVNDGSVSITVYFSVNEQNIVKKQMKLAIDGIFPTIYMLRDGVKVKYFNIE